MHGERYPGYDVLARRHTVSWNEQTRRAIDRRLAVDREPRFFTEREWRALQAVCNRIIPQPRHRLPVPIPALIDLKLRQHRRDGFRNAALPPQDEAWRRGLGALDAQAQRIFGVLFCELGEARQDSLLERVQHGEFEAREFAGMPSALFFSERVIPDITTCYYSHPTSWNEIGWGGPASPRGYVRTGFDRWDPWEPVEAKPGSEQWARWRNRSVG